MQPNDYVAAAMETMPPELHFDKFTSGQMFAALMAASAAGNGIDPFKKSLVYGRPIPNDSPYFKAKKVADPKGDIPGGVIHGLIGMISESGEIADLLITAWFGGDVPLDRVNLREELGDFLWYMARVLNTMQTLFPDEDWSFGAIMAGNIGKLRLRHDPGNKGGVAFNPNAHDHANRDKDAERAAIEQAGHGEGDTLEAQVKRLGDFILATFPSEPSQNEGAVDTAIRLLRAYRGDHEIGRFDRPLDVVLDESNDDPQTAAQFLAAEIQRDPSLACDVARLADFMGVCLKRGSAGPAAADDGVHRQSSPAMSTLASGILHRTQGDTPWLDDGFDARRLVSEARKLAASVLGQDETAGQG